MPKKTEGLKKCPKTKHQIHVYKVEALIRLNVEVPHSFEMWEDKDDLKARKKARKLLQDLHEKGKLKWEKADCGVLVIDLETLRGL